MVNVYRLVTRGTYEEQMYQRANFKLGLERAVIGKGGYHRQEKGGAASAEAKPEQSAAGAKLKAAEIEELLKNGAQALFTPEHDAQVTLQP